MNAQQLLHDAATIIRLRGLAKGNYEDAHGGVCVLGALNLAYHGSSEPPDNASGELHLAVKQLTSASMFMSKLSPEKFSDHTTTTKQDVITLLRLTANSFSPP